MKKLVLLLNVILAIGLVLLLNNRISTSKRPLPAFGKMLNPFDGVWSNIENKKEFKDFSLQSEYLQDEVEVVFDDRMVPHIHAQNTQDLFFAQGYVEAYLRVWQMDMTARSAAGRISEVVGKAALENDMYKRKLGLNKGAERCVENWKKYTDGSLKESESYIAGINHYINQIDNKSLPIEFKILDYKPETWSLYKTALVQKSMGLVLASRGADVSNTNAKLYFSEADYDHLYGTYDSLQTPIIRKSKVYEFDSVHSRVLPDSALYDGAILDGISVTPYEKGIGSNNWAIGPERTKTGFPILANDPHLRLTLPSIWYEVHLSTPEINAYGVSIPGIPGIVIGFNEKIAWGMTNVGHDVRDYYAIDWEDEEKTQYVVDGEVRKCETRTETIKVAFGEDRTMEIKETEFGPIYFESNNDTVPDLAMQWLVTARPESDDLATLTGMMKAKDYEAFKTATANYEVPAQNFIFAANDGTIALRVNGKLPLKAKEEGFFVKKGDQSEYKWTEYIPREQNPQYENPPENYIGSANQVSAGPNYPYYFNGGFEDFRGRRVYEMLEENDQVDWKYMQTMHQDNYSLKAERILPILLDDIKGLTFENGSSKIIQALTNWDYRYYSKANAPSYFEKWFEAFEKTYWDELQKDFSLPYPEEFRRLEIYQDPNDLFADKLSTDGTETRKDISVASFVEALKFFNENPDKEAYFQYRPFIIRHLARIDGFGRSKLKVSGHGDVLNANNKFGAGPSWRMIVELNEKVKARAVYPGGQSGNPGSPFYDDSVDTWLEGNYNEISIYESREDLKKRKLFEIKLQPKS